MVSRTFEDGPQAVFFDFGGVLSEVRHDPDGFVVTAQAIAGVLEHAGVDVPVLSEITEDLVTGSAAFEDWKDSQSRVAAPHEPSAAEFWGRFITSGWPPAAQQVVALRSRELCEVFEASTVKRPLLAGAIEMLEGLCDRGIPTALICNTLSGAGTRRLVVDYGLASLLNVEIYSEIVGIRKPNPAIFDPALVILDVSPTDVWYVGDKLDRDVLAARRAGLGAAILMQTGPLEPADPAPRPDVVVETPQEVLGLVCEHAKFTQS